jgi:hypothetical protein
VGILVCVFCVSGDGPGFAALRLGDDDKGLSPPVTSSPALPIGVTGRGST